MCARPLSSLPLIRRESKNCPCVHAITSISFCSHPAFPARPAGPLPQAQLHLFPADSRLAACVPKATAFPLTASTTTTNSPAPAAPNSRLKSYRNLKSAITASPPNPAAHPAAPSTSLRALGPTSSTATLSSLRRTAPPTPVPRLKRIQRSHLFAGFARDLLWAAQS